MALTTDSATYVATWTFPGLSGGRLPEGNYLATLDAAGVHDAAGNVMQDDYVFEFHVCPGMPRATGE